MVVVGYFRLGLGYFCHLVIEFFPTFLIIRFFPTLLLFYFVVINFYFDIEVTSQDDPYCRSFVGWLGFLGSCRCFLLVPACFFPGGHRKLLLQCSLVCILVLSIWFPCFLHPWSYPRLLGWLSCWLSRFLRLLLICLFCFSYPFVSFDVGCLHSSLHSVIRAMSTFSVSKGGRGGGGGGGVLLFFPFIPLVFMLAIIRFLFFLILGLLVFLFTWFLWGEVVTVVLVSNGLDSVDLIGSLGLYIFVLVGPNFTSLLCAVLGFYGFYNYIYCY